MRLVLHAPLPDLFCIICIIWCFSIILSFSRLIIIFFI